MTFAIALPTYREMPFIKLGRSLRFDIKDLEAMIEEAKVKPRELPFFVGKLGGS